MVPYLALCRQDSEQRGYPQRAVFNALRYIVRTGSQYVTCPTICLPRTRSETKMARVASLGDKISGEECDLLLTAFLLIAFGPGTLFGTLQVRAQVVGKDHWVPAWASAQQGPEETLSIRAATFADQSIRMFVRTAVAGTRARVLLSNVLSETPLRFGAAHIALAADRCSVVPGSDHVLKFSGRQSIIIPAGAQALSDPVNLNVSAFREVAISLFIPQKSIADTFHFLAQHPTCVSESGDLTGQEQWPGAEQKHSWYWLARVDIWGPAATNTIVALGDSITDGFGATGKYFDWPDLLAGRLSSSGRYEFSVINEGIGGNRLLHDGDGPSALARLDRDVLSQPSVRNLIILEGLNDIGWPAMEVPIDALPGTVRERPFEDQQVTSGEVIQALHQIIAMAHERRIKVFGCTLTPYRGSFFYTQAGDGVRETINRWIRTSHSFDGVFDFDKAVRDPGEPDRLLPRFQSGDWLHPNNAGYAAMVDAINLALFSEDGAGSRDSTSKPHLPRTSRSSTGRVSQ